MNIDQLRCFIILSETLSFSRTAEIVNITQPAVSFQIKKLEDRLKFKLFIRSSKSVSLTVEGSHFYYEVKDIVNQLQIAIDKSMLIKKNTSGVIKIGYDGHDIEKINLPEIISEFKSVWPESSVLVFKANHKERYNALLNRKFDIILTTKDNIENMEGVVYKEIISAGLICLVSEKNPLSALASISVGDIKNENIILLDPFLGPRDINIAQERLNKLLPDASYIYTESECSAAILISCNEGVAIMPSFSRPYISGIIQIIKPLMALHI